MKRNEAITLSVLLVSPIIAAILSLLLKVNGVTSLVLFMGLPALYLSLRVKKYIRKAMFFSVTAGVPAGIVLDYLGHLNKTWFVPTIFPFRIFGLATVETVLWLVVNLYFVLMFYEYFLDKHVTKKLMHPNMKYLIVSVVVIFLAFVVSLLRAPNRLHIPYFYLTVGLTTILIPTLIEFLKYPKFISKFFMATAYFFYLTFIYEVTALKLNLWSFPGTEFIGWVSVFGVHFPAEELVFWVILSTMAILSYYEFFDDGEK